MPRRKIVLQQFGKERLVDPSSPGELPISVTRELATGDFARQTVERRVRWPGVEPENARWIVVEHREIGDPAEIQNGPPASCSRFPSAEQNGISHWRERRTFAAGGDIASTEVGNDVAPRPYSDDIAVPELKRCPCVPRDAAVMIDRLAVRADKVHFAGETDASSSESRQALANASPSRTFSSAMARRLRSAALRT